MSKSSLTILAITLALPVTWLLMTPSRACASSLIAAPVSVRLNRIPDQAEIIFLQDGYYTYAMDRHGGNVTQKPLSTRATTNTWPSLLIVSSSSPMNKGNAGEGFSGNLKIK